MSPRQRLFPFLLLAVVLHFSTAAAETRVGGDINGQVRWTRAQSPFIVTEDITVQRGASLTIEPGCVFRFKPNLADQKGRAPFHAELTVYGSLEARGADNDSIFFTSDAIEPTTKDWAGIIVPEPGARVVLDRCVIEYATVGLTLVGGECDVSRSAIRYCQEKGVNILRGRGRLYKNYITIIGNFAGTGKGIYLVQSSDVDIEENLVIGAQSAIQVERGSNARIIRNQILASKVYGLAVTNSSPEITGNTISQNEYGLLLNGGAMPKVRDNNIFENASYDLKVLGYKKTSNPAEKPIQLDLSGNWWGNYTVDVVYDKIDDSDDDPTIGAHAVIEPVRKEAYRAE